MNNEVFKSEPTIPDGLVTAKDLPRVIFPNGGACLRTIRRWTKSKKIPYVRMGGRYFYEPSRVLAAIRKMETPAAV